MKQINKHKILEHLIFWPSASISMLMNIWLFSSFFAQTYTKICGGCIGITVDLMKLLALSKWNNSRILNKENPEIYKLDYQRLIYYLLCFFVSAAASVLFSLMDIQDMIKNKALPFVSQEISIEEIQELKKQKEDLLNFSSLNEFEKSAIKNVSSLTYRISERTAQIQKIQEKIQRQKKARIKEAEEINIKLKVLVKNKAVADINKSKTKEAFAYAASIIPFLDEKQVRVIFLLFIVFSLDIGILECANAMRIFTQVKANEGIKKSPVFLTKKKRGMNK